MAERFGSQKTICCPSWCMVLSTRAIELCSSHVGLSVCILFENRSLQHRKELRSKTWKVKGWGESVQQTVGLIDHMQSRILQPLVLSKKKVDL